MTATPSLRPSSFPRIVLLLLVASFLLTSSPPAWAQGCETGCGRADCATPVKPVPASLWGDLQPAETSLPLNRDATSFNEFRETYFSRNWYFALDVEGNNLFSVLSHGLQIWDISSPSSPSLRSQVKESGNGTVFPVWVDSAEVKWPLVDVDVPDGNDNVAAVVGGAGIGFAVFDTSNKNQPKIAYQSHHKDGFDVYSTTIGNSSYAFAATSSGLIAYNLTAARQFNRCSEGTPAVGESTNCAGVNLGRVGARTDAKYVSGAGNYVAVSFGASGAVGQRGFEVWDVSNPASPQLRLAALTGEFVYGTAMWQDGNRTLIGLRTGSQGRIYDLSCLASGSCSSSPAPLWSQTLDTGTVNFFVTYSRSGSVPFLYFGSDNRCGGGTQREWLFDVSNPSSPDDITPAAKAVNGATTGYWGWYYRGNPTGFNLVMPRMGKFHGDHFYRAGLSILDIHKRTTSSPPTADFEFSPIEVYPGTAVNFTDRTTGAPFSWSWTFGGGSPASAQIQNPQGVTFAQPGPATVSLQVANSVGNASKTKTVTVLDPAPQVGAITVSPQSPKVCQTVTFSAGATGRPPLVFLWDIKNSANMPVPVANNTGTSFQWATQGLTAGAYTATVSVSNGTGAPAIKSVAVNLGALPDLPSAETFAPTNDPFAAGTVQFHAGVVASEYSWDFGDGSGFRAWTENANPSFSYTTTGQKVVRVKVRNCGGQTPDGAERVSSPLTINVTQVAPLKAAFQATGIFCSGLGCLVSVNQAVVFTDSSTGAELYDFDWNGDGDFTDAVDQANVAANSNVFTVSGGTRTISHAFATAGEFAPRMRVRRGANEEDIATHRTITVGTSGGGGGGGGGGISLSVSCSPSSVQVGVSAACTASATGCTPASNGWTWNTSGGTAAGGGASVISVNWSSTGNKAVSVSNSNCGTASAATAVTVTQSGGGGGGGGVTGPLSAAYTFTPAGPKAGQAITFDASSSVGPPVEYAWSFGDNTQATGKIVSKTYTNPGAYQVRLTVTKPGSGSNCFFGTCAAETVKTVVVAPNGPVEQPVSAEFTADVACVNQFGFNSCEAAAGKTVTLTANLTDATSYAWTFGDGGTATGRTVTHVWNNAGEFPVSLNVTKGASNASHTRTFVITGPPAPTVKSVVLPWIAQTRGALNQSSDLYVHNPGTAAMEVTIEFRKRGTPEANPPRVTRTIQPGATLYVADALDQLFDRENVAGFITVLVEGPVEPIITSFNTTVQTDGSQFGQTVPGISLTQAKAVPATQHLVGLNDNSDRLSYFGVSNPSETPSTYQLRFFDHLGQTIGTPQTGSLPRFGQVQFQVRQIREFGVTDEDDYRIEITSQNGVPLFPYGANLRLASDDPSFVGVGSLRNEKAYLLGALSARGIGNSLWQTDVVLSNTSNQVVLTDLTFTRLGTGDTSVPTSPLRLTLQPGETRRLANVVADQWDIEDAVGVLTIDSDSPNSVFPVVQGESYENSRPAKRFGQSMAALSDSDAAGTGQGSYLVGLRQDAKNRTTVWLFNPSTAPGDYDLIYRALDGSILGRTNGVKLGAGKVRQISPSQHPIPAAGAAGGFTLQVVPKSGKVLSAAQVVNNATNDPAYIEGRLR